MIRPCPVTASAAAHAHDRDHRDAQDRYEENLTERAIDDLVDRIERGDEYPRRHNGMDQINRLDILCAQDAETLARLIDKEMTDGPVLDLEVPKLIRAYFEAGKGAHWVTQRAEELREEDREDAEQAAIDRKLMNREEA